MWTSLFRAGAMSAAAAVLLYLMGLVIVALSDPAPDSGAGGAAMLKYVDAHRTGYIIRQVLWEAPALFLMVVVLALAVALRGHNRSLAAVTGLIGVSSWALSFAWPTTGDGSLAMETLSDRYGDATTATEQASLVAGADLLNVLNDMPVIGVLQTLGVLLISLLMLRATTLGPRLAWLGVATGGIGIMSEALRPILGWAYAVYGLLLFVWLACVAVVLWQLARARPPSAVGADPARRPRET